MRKVINTQGEGNVVSFLLPPAETIATAFVDAIPSIPGLLGPAEAFRNRYLRFCNLDPSRLNRRDGALCAFFERALNVSRRESRSMPAGISVVVLPRRRRVSLGTDEKYSRG